LHPDLRRSTHYHPETCEDGHTITGDGCSDDCLTEPGWIAAAAAAAQPSRSMAAPSVRHRATGDGVLEGAEECDDGPANSDANYDGCSSHCVYLCCGDGIVNGDEKRDLGRARNTTAYERTDCKLAWRWLTAIVS
jgi:cysteine-rich repeat protein